MAQHIVTPKELAKHGASWLAVEGVVYDVAEFLESHPGGSEVLAESMGKDATEAFCSGVHAHSQAARDLLPAMRVGVLKGHEGKASSAPVQESDAQRRAREVIDPKKPYTWQVGSLGQLYQEWVHTPIHVAEPLVLLGSWMEPFTKVYWWVPLVFWGPAIVAMLAYAAKVWHWWQIAVVYVIMACLGWPVIEYCLHRGLYHMHTESYWGNTAHFLFHGVHHLTPMDKTRLVAPPLLAILISTPLVAIVYVLAPSSAFAWTVAAGGFSGYLVYDMSHYAMHHANLPFAWLHRLKAHHMAHHYGHPNFNFGVSNTWTDVLMHSDLPSTAHSKTA